MASSLTGTVGSTNINLSNKSPFSLVSARGLSGAEIRRVTSRGPAQDGDTDKGYRLAPRMMEIVIGIQGATNAALDGHRDTLTSFFKPLPNTPIKLRYTRDDTEIRQIDCYTVGDIKIDLVPENRVGHYHEATIRLRAADPSFYDPTPGTVTVTGTALPPSWWLAGGVIGTAQVLMHGGTPSPGESWSYAGTLADSVGWTLAWRGSPPSAGTNQFAYWVDANGGATFSSTADFWFGHSDISNVAYALDGYGADDQVMNGGTLNLFHSYFEYGHANYGSRRLGVSLFTDQSQIFNDILFTPSNPQQMGGTIRKWRTNSAGGTAWSAAIPLYALYSPRLTDAQILALNGYMSGAAGGSVSQLLVIPYEGDLPSYPSISIRGPITGARIVNSITGYELDFGTVVIGAGTTYVINTDPAYRTVLLGTVNKRGELTKASDLGAWSLLPAPQATGGTNIITVNGSNTGTATQVSIVYNNRYMSF